MSSMFCKGAAETLMFSVAGTVFNQTGAVMEIVVIMMLSYLSISLLTSLLMNIYNRRIQLVER